MVQISERQQLLFFHVPKCAGESMCKFDGILTRGPDRGRGVVHLAPVAAQHVFELASDSHNPQDQALCEYAQFVLMRCTLPVHTVHLYMSMMYASHISHTITITPQA